MSGDLREEKVKITKFRFIFTKYGVMVFTLNIIGANRELP